MKDESYIRYALILLSIVFFVLLFFLFRGIIRLKRSEIINAREVQISNFLKSRGPLTINDVGIVTPWMTFSYINTLFAVPSEYLKTTLTISDSRYPQISLSGYARSKGINTAVFVSNVQTALRDYLSITKP